ncbi:hypothetical protein SNR37_000252 [Agarivorans aestuarii]|uniref:Uncharacterized protein n=1 Tax=Agarivorans aestuarii TaxID=1563703 RepID=A0ABU7G6A0_9ALTE|nr:hypothetical protein [Agarivorans aestuarii]MEE1674932.1 hypothetical protein [Agarivorans aestuarii]
MFLKNNPRAKATLNESNQVAACIAGYQLTLIGNPLAPELLSTTFTHLDYIGYKEYRTHTISLAKNVMVPMDTADLKQRMQQADCENLTRSLKATYFK